METIKKYRLYLIFIIILLVSGFKYYSYQKAAMDIAFFKVNGMTCSSCEQTVIVEAKKYKAIKHINPDHESGDIIVTFNKNKISKLEIEKMIESTGYKIVKKPNPLNINKVKMKVFHL
jgi:copper chaperone CopZ